MVSIKFGLYNENNNAYFMYSLSVLSKLSRRYKQNRQLGGFHSLKDTGFEFSFNTYK